MKYFLIAGEKSGDLHGSHLIRSLAENDDDSSFYGVGGDGMREAGMELAFHFREISYMGIVDVIRHLPELRRYLRKCKSEIERVQPDVIILIDFAGFNLRIARWASSIGVRVFYYISPKVWAWNQSRAKAIRKVVDKMFVILPFEVEFYRKFDWEVEYVGNPVVNAVDTHEPEPDFRGKNDLPYEDLVALLPGSRIQEVTKILPVMLDLCRKFPDQQFVVAGVNNLDDSVYDTGGLGNVKVVYEQNYDLLLNSSLAVVTSGTATLETALFNVPQIVVYKTQPLTYMVGKILVKIPHISLVNIIAGKEVVPELLQKDLNQLWSSFRDLYNDQELREKQREGYEEVREKLGSDVAPQITAEKMISALRQP